MEDPLPQHRSPSPPAPSTNKRHSFSSPSPQSFPTSKAFLIKARRRLSEHRPSVSLPSLLNLRNLGLEGQKKLPKFLQTSEPAAPIRASSVAPTHHRENTALHALFDTLPTLPAFRTPSLPSFPKNLGFTTPSLFRTTATSDTEDPSPTSSPPNGEKESKNDPLKALSGNVVVMGGYRGSILRDAKTGKRVWIPLRVGFGLRKPQLGLGLTDEEEERSTETVVAGRMVMAIAGVVDLGKRLKDKLKSLESSTASEAKSTPSKPILRFHNWGYDWRRRLELSSAELLAYLENLKAESAARGEGLDGTGEGATVIAHSMGGLVALHALASAADPTIFRGIIFAGTPFQGCVNILSPLRRGDSFRFNREICSPAVVFSMRSSFYFLPLSGKCFETCDGEELPVDFFSPQAWSDYNISPLASALLDPEGEAKQRRRRQNRLDAQRASEGGDILEPNLAAQDVEEELDEEIEVDGEEEPESVGMSREGSKSPPASPPNGPLGPSSDEMIKSYLSTTLQRVQDFHAQITNRYDPSKSHLYPPMVILTSQKTPTVRGVLSPTHDSIKTGNYEHLLFGAGDGIVLYDSAKELPGGEGKWMRHLRGVEESSHGHVSLLGDLGGVRRCLDKLYG